MHKIESSKPTLEVQKLRHRNAEWWALKCNNKEPFNSIVKQVEGRRWSATWNVWLIPQATRLIDELKQKLQGQFEIIIIDKDAELKKVETAEKGCPPAIYPSEIWSKTIIRPLDPSSQTGRKSNIQLKISKENQIALNAFGKELVLKGYSPSTIKTYTGEFMSFLQIIKGVPATEFSPERLKDYLYYCATELKLSESTLHSKINALKFYYEQVLGREKFFWDVPRPKKKQQNPAMFNQDEIAAIIKGTENIKHKAMLMVAYSSGLRVSEVVALKPSNIDSKRMCLHIEQGKGKKDRMVSLSPVLLVMLREYWQQWKPKPKVYLFEGQEAGIQYSTRSLQEVLQQAKDRASIKKKGSIHALRHSFATHLLDKGADVSMIMKLLGHNDVRTTMRYLHVTNRDLLQIVSPLDSLNL